MTPAGHSGAGPSREREGFLETLGATHAGFLHARGEAASDLLVRRLNCAPRDAVLDFGCGTGATLVKLAARLPGLSLSGVDASAVMLRSASARVRFCGVARRVRLYPAQTSGPLPFADATFDRLYGESVLAILDDATAGAVLDELRRVLKVGGTACFNETVWREGTSAAEIDRINRACAGSFGIIQSSASRPSVAAWHAYFASHGFTPVTTEPVDALPEPGDPKRPPELLSRLFTVVGGLKRRLHPRLSRLARSYRRAARELAIGERQMEGILFTLRRES